MANTNVPEQGIMLNHVAYVDGTPIQSGIFLPALKGSNQRITIEATTTGNAQVDELDDDGHFRDRTGPLAVAANDPTYIVFENDVFNMRLTFTPTNFPGNVFAQANSMPKGT